jgi:curli biogenesis system outer membrane secretion channel CsgG
MSKAVLLCFVLTLCSSAQVRRVAVYDFDDKNIREEVQRALQSNRNVGAQIANRVINRLVNGGSGIDVIDRAQIDRIMREQNLRFSDRFDPKDAPKLGRLLNVDAIVTGTVESVVTDIKDNRIGIGPVGYGKSEAVAEVTASTRVISTETGRIVYSETETKRATYKLGQNYGKTGRGATSTQSGSRTNSPVQMAAARAIDEAGDELGSKILERIKDVPARAGSSAVSSNVERSAPPKPATGSSTQAFYVGRVDGNKVYVGAGENVGLKVNDVLEIRRATGSMKLPNGETIQTDELVETITLTDVEEKYAIGTPSGARSGAKEGDRARLMRKPAAPKSKPVKKPA